MEISTALFSVINLYKKLGFIIEGVKRDEVNKNGVWVNSIIMSILHDEYKEKI